MNVKNRGFASLTPEQRREIASRGGKKSHANGTAHKWTAKTAKAAGEKGVKARQAKEHNVAPETPTE